MAQTTKKNSTPQTIEEAKSKQKTYLIIFIAGLAATILFAAVVPQLLGDFTSLLALVSLGVTAYSGLVLNVARKIIKSFKNTTCDSCNTRLVYDSNTKYDVLKKWTQTNRNESNGDILSKTMFNVSVTAMCPSCRRTKTFQTTLATDMIRVTGNLGSIKSSVDGANLEDVVKAYFKQNIRQ
jgi:RNase P subunit RPR2